MKKEVVEFTCDNCGADATAKGSKLPLHWVTILYILHHGKKEAIDLCKDCREAMENALAERRTKK